MKCVGIVSLESISNLTLVQKLQYCTCGIDVIISYKFKMALIWNKNVMNDAQPRISILLPFFSMVTS